MISAKKLIKLAKKWQKLAALRRKRIALPQMETSSRRTSEMADKGHFVVYSTDQKRFLLPLNYLNRNHKRFREGNIGVHSQQSLLVVFGSPSSSNRPSITNM
ncbi:hypothetical protein OIU85_007245 [Salix viminalis]|uniref:Auxin-responsive protein n=1 Tax=Salix viminalis TaxID=40686 RepID=A0A9Q0SNF9_SALVM|nr:hypothetical protein OIU85_007245 [Salix viminalis]